jgi:outer membrane lipoprotein SlyB
MANRIPLLALGFSTILLSACSSKAPPSTNVSLAANRVMGLGIRSLKSNNQNTGDIVYFSKLAQKALSASYGAKVSEVRISPNEPLETPENLFQIGKLLIDDFFVIDATIVGDFEIPTVNEAAPPQVPTELNDQYIDFQVSIYNGANLRAVNVFSFKVPTHPPSAFESSMIAAFRKASLSAFPNPNIYPRSEPKHFANLLFTFAESHEKDSHQALSCENAPELLKYYAAAKLLYDLAVAKGTSKVVGTQAESHQLTSRQTESATKAQIIDNCIADQTKTFEMNLDYGSIVSTNQVFIQRTLESLGFEALLRQYTSKPVRFSFRVESDGNLTLTLDMRFDRTRYRAWTIDRIPARAKNMQVLSLDPYYALMQKMVMFRHSLPPETPFALRSAFENMKMMLKLSTLLNGDVSFSVDGKFIKDQMKYSMAYPNALYITAPGFDKKLVQNRDPEIFQEKGWIALGNCKTIEGAKTEDGLIYDFFGFPCQ